MLVFSQLNKDKKKERNILKYSIKKLNYIEQQLINLLLNIEVIIIFIYKKKSIFINNLTYFLHIFFVSTIIIIIIIIMITS